MTLAVDALKDALAEAGEIPPPSPGIPEGMECVTIKQWQEHVERLGGGDVTANGSKERRAFDRAKKWLLDRRHIGIHGAQVWPV